MTDETELNQARQDAANAAAHAKAMAWFVRYSFEKGYRSAKPDTQPNEWRDAWRASEERQKLKEMGYIEEGDTYR